jgi:polyphosphate kinase
MMVRSFDKRLESLFKVESPLLEKQLMNILAFNLKDNANSYTMQEDGTYLAKEPAEGEAKFNIHQKFFQLNAAEVLRVKLVPDPIQEVTSIPSSESNADGL